MSVRRRGNGLTADSYVRLLDVDPRLADHLLVALASANVAAYTTPAPGRSSPTLELHLPSRPMEVVHVDSTRRPAARRVLEATMPDMTVGMPTVEEEDEFAALVAAWDEAPATASWPAEEDTEPSDVDVANPPRRRRTDRRPVKPEVGEPSDTAQSDTAEADTAQQAPRDATGSTAAAATADVEPDADAESAAHQEPDQEPDSGPRSRVIRWSGPSLEKSSPAAGDERAEAEHDQTEDVQAEDNEAEDNEAEDDDGAEDHYVPPPLPP